MSGLVPRVLPEQDIFWWEKKTTQKQQGMAGLKGLRELQEHICQKGAAHQRSEPNEIYLCVCVSAPLFWGGVFVES